MIATPIDESIVPSTHEFLLYKLFKAIALFLYMLIFLVASIRDLLIPELDLYRFEGITLPIALFCAAGASCLGFWKKPRFTLCVILLGLTALCVVSTVFARDHAQTVRLNIRLLGVLALGVAWISFGYDCAKHREPLWRRQGIFILAAWSALFASNMFNREAKNGWTEWTRESLNAFLLFAPALLICLLNVKRWVYRRRDAIPIRQ